MDTPPRRVGLRDVAKAADVCLMTVSLSLRDSPKISQQTRRRVRALAEKLGYRPDPEVARLMGRLRSSRMSKGSVTIALLDLRLQSGVGEHPYNAGIRKGVEAKAESLGLGVSLLRVRDYGGDARKMMRVIRSRGITGVILLPSDEPVVLDPGIKWDGLSVVAATTSVLAPRFHRVVPNQIYNSMHLFETMQARDYRRIGMILSDSLEQRTAHYYSMVATWFGHGGRVLILPGTSTPAESDETVRGWLREQRPDLIIAQNTDVVAHLLRKGRQGVDGRIGMVSLSTRNDARIAYQDELPDHVGACAVSQLTGMIHNNETGVPLHPQVTTIDGQLREGLTVRAAPSVKKRRPAASARA